jgi:hypothetical protein
MVYKQKEMPTFEQVEFGEPFCPPYDYDKSPVVINPSEWTHLCSARFGEARRVSWNKSTRWTGSSYRYDIFQRYDEVGRLQLALRWCNGAGQGWLLTEDKSGSDVASMLDMVASVGDENRRWDYCHFLWTAVHGSGVRAALLRERELKKAFMEGRLKKIKSKGAYSVIVVDNHA